VVAAHGVEDGAPHQQHARDGGARAIFHGGDGVPGLWICVCGGRLRGGGLGGEVKGKGWLTSPLDLI
jgi:hypothetical protein